MESSILIAGQTVAQEILRRGAVESVWINCPVPATPESPAECRQPPNATRLVVTVVPRWADGDLDKATLGLAVEVEHGFGSYCYVFQERLDDLAAAKHISPARLLGHAMAHEIGHLLKGTNSHSAAGLMSKHWFANQLQAAKMGSLDFTPADVAVMRNRLAEAEATR